MKKTILISMLLALLFVSCSALQNRYYPRRVQNGDNKQAVLRRLGKEPDFISKIRYTDTSLKQDDLLPKGTEYPLEIYNFNIDDSIGKQVFVENFGLDLYDKYIKLGLSKDYLLHIVYDTKNQKVIDKSYKTK